jgi:cellobiose epimerase
MLSSKHYHLFTKQLGLKISILLLGILMGVFFTNCATQNNTADNIKLAAVLDSSLKHNILDHWYPLTIDTADGGYLSNFSFDWKPWPNQSKMLVTQSRHIWTSSQASMFYHDDTYTKYAKHGFKFLKNHMWDQVYGGFFNMRSKNGSHTDEVFKDEKRAYGNAFAIYGLTSLYNASKDKEALDYAKKTFLWLDKHSHDSIYGGYFDVMNQDGTWKFKNEDKNSRDYLEDASKDYNSSIHILECFTELYKIWPDPLVKSRLHEMMTLVRDTFIGPKGYLSLYFNREWKHVSNKDSGENIIRKKKYIDHITFGHDVETAFLLLEASYSLGIENDTTTLRVARLLVDNALKNGYNQKSGGFYSEGYYFADKKAFVILDENAEWWIQAEGLNALLLMSEIYPKDAKYRDSFLKIWNYIDKNLIDKKYGDWYISGLDTNPNAAKAPKSTIWKANYHNGRALMNCIRMLKGENEITIHFNKLANN